MTVHHKKDEFSHILHDISSQRQLQNINEKSKSYLDNSNIEGQVDLIDRNSVQQFNLKHLKQNESFSSLCRIDNNLNLWEQLLLRNKSTTFFLCIARYLLLIDLNSKIDDFSPFKLRYDKSPQHSSQEDD